MARCDQMAADARQSADEAMRMSVEAAARAKVNSHRNRPNRNVPPQCDGKDLLKRPPPKRPAQLSTSDQLSRSDGWSPDAIKAPPELVDRMSTSAMSFTMTSPMKPPPPMPPMPTTSGQAAKAELLSRQSPWRCRKETLFGVSGSQGKGEASSSRTTWRRKTLRTSDSRLEDDVSWSNFGSGHATAAWLLCN